VFNQSIAYRDKKVVGVFVRFRAPTNNNVTIIQCDDDLDAVTTFNLTVKNDEISSNFTMKPFLTTPHLIVLPQQTL
jgi:hypothetical protein